MTSRAVQISPSAYARIGGCLYLFIIIVGVTGELIVRGRLVERGDATATVNNITASETLFRAALLGDILGYVASVALALILYVLLAPVSRNLALMALLLSIVATAVFGFNGIFHLAALVALEAQGSLHAFDSEQLHALAYLSLRLHSYGFAVSLMFFGFFLLPLGYLIYSSGFLPRVIGILLIAGGLGYLTNSVAQILSPSLADRLLPWDLLPAFVAELAFALWLIVKGIDVPAWNKSVQGQENILPDRQHGHTVP